MRKINTRPIPTLAESITKAASKQTYYTIRFLVDRDRVADAYRAYAYFRWVDDILDSETGTRTERITFINRQKDLLERLYRGVLIVDMCAEEKMLFELVKSDGDADSGLHAYLHNMMAVMAFDVERRGRSVSQADLDQYSHWLAVAVTEAMHYFIGHGDGSPHDESRYQAVTGAHISHMLRDALEDAKTGYYNIPRERVAAYPITLRDVKSKVYREWVKENVTKARGYFITGRKYLARVENFRCRIAGYSYIRRFEIVLDSIEREGCLLREEYPERKTYKQRIKLLFWAFWMALDRRQAASATST